MAIKLQNKKAVDMKIAIIKMSSYQITTHISATSNKLAIVNEFFHFVL
jgi:hypothetical protein